MFGKVIAVILLVILGLFIIGSIKSIVENLKARKEANKNKPAEDPEKGDKEK